MSRTPPELNHRERATLHAIAAGRVEMTCSCEPDLFVDGACSCDQVTNHGLVRSGYLRAARTGGVGARVAAHLTEAGYRALAATA